ncbi:Protein N-acetyltransferase, RimJ/RimL family [Planococcus glaciei]|uniref:GNAT family N-acetyltransferase n=1 Tax=Planococcus glaciei TaxID=459472 RepID=UPI0008881B2E|nr:GNAT family N-acetyltransferase [Planococcus glaciei]SDH13744.1 Protein N-acetyltransferase, RimJ/RimL family [Planococcus glaciei]
MDIRELTAADAAAYRELRIEALTNNPDAFGSVLKDALQKPVETTAENLASPLAVTFGAFSEGRLVGNVTLLREAAKKMKHRANVVAVYVTPRARGNGVASRLMEELLDYANEWEGIEQLYLTVSSHNRSAIRLYERFGFEKYGTEYRAMKSGDEYTDEDLMVKFL